MSKIQRTEEELVGLLYKQIHLLVKSCKSYDSGDCVESINMSARIRVMMHDTKKSRSLLKALGKKDVIRLYDSRLPIDGVAGLSVKTTPIDGKHYWPNFAYEADIENGEMYYGLIVKQITFINSDESKLEFVPLYEYKFGKIVDFETWWNGIVFDDRCGNALTRKDVILFVSNIDGGSHVDNVPEIFHHFKNKKVIQYRSDRYGLTKENPISSTVRQISYELLYSFYKMGIITNQPSVG